MQFVECIARSTDIHLQATRSLMFVDAMTERGHEHLSKDLSDGIADPRMQIMLHLIPDGALQAV